MDEQNIRQPHRSLSDVHQTVDPSTRRTAWGKILAFFGPAYLVSVGYMDPGNWATDIAGGSGYGYSLLWVLLMSNIMAFLLQSFSARLGIVRGLDLAQASRQTYPPLVNYCLYGLAEIAIAACDLAEVLGMAIGLELLFGVPLLWGVGLTILDTFLLLFLQRLGMRKMEMFIISLIAIIGLSFAAQLLMASPDAGGIVRGFVPHIADSRALLIAIGIIGATVMPHNLYLHSALVQTRKIDRDPASVRRALRLSNWDSGIAFNMAFLVNASILILGAAVFYRAGHHDVEDIKEAHRLLTPLLGSLAPVLFAVALIASGQSSTITGTLAGQIVMEGYLHLRLPIWLRRSLTRLLAVAPAFFTVWFYGEDSAGELLILSQVILSFQLGFAVIPLIHMVSDRENMGAYTVPVWMQVLAWVIAAVILSFNIILVGDVLGRWFAAMPPEQQWLKVLVIVIITLLVLLLLYITFIPFIRRRQHAVARLPHGTAGELSLTEPDRFKKIAIAVDFSDTDRKSLQHALAQGGRDAEYVLIHIVETPNAMLSEQTVHDMESRVDIASLNHYVALLQAQGYKAGSKIGYGRRARAIAELVEAEKATLLVMGSHGHRGLGDLVRGETIDAVRHRISVPLLAVK